MAFALHPDGATEVVERPVDIAVGGPPSRGATVVDWTPRGEVGGPLVRILMRYDHARFEALLQGALRGRGQGDLHRPGGNG